MMSPSTWLILSVGLLSALCADGWAQESAVSPRDQQRLRELREERRSESTAQHQERRMRREARLEKRRQERAQRKQEKQAERRSLVEKYHPSRNLPDQGDPTHSSD